MAAVAAVRPGLVVPLVRMPPVAGMLVAAALAALLGLFGAAVQTASADSPSSAELSSDAQIVAVLEEARSHLGKAYKLGAEGPEFFDCSGLVFRIFEQAGEVDLIGGARRRAVGYYRWFAAAGRASSGDPKPGDLVVWGDGKHIGIYLGDGRAVSALLDGITEHGVHGINWPFTAYLHVDWGTGPTRGHDPPASGDDYNLPIGSSPEPEIGEQVEGDPDEVSTTINADAVGTMNLRVSPGPDREVTGWVGRRATFTVLDRGYSPRGALWYSVVKRDGKTGWVYSRWVNMTSDVLTWPTDEPLSAEVRAIERD